VVLHLRLGNRPKRPSSPVDPRGAGFGWDCSRRELGPANDDEARGAPGPRKNPAADRVDSGRAGKTCQGSEPAHVGRTDGRPASATCAVPDVMNAWIRGGAPRRPANSLRGPPHDVRETTGRDLGSESLPACIGAAASMGQTRARLKRGPFPLGKVPVSPANARRPSPDRRFRRTCHRARCLRR